MINRFDVFATTITQIYKSIQRIKNREMTELGLRGTCVMCLFYLKIHEEGVTLTRLSALCEEDKSAISRIVQELTDNGYITSQSDKKYRAPLTLTQKGQDAAIRIEEMISNAVAAGGEGLTEEERHVFYNSLKLISANLKKYLGEE